LGLDLFIQKIILQKRYETKRYFSKNETKRNDVFFGTETGNRNEIKKKIQKRKRTKRKKNNVFEPQELQLSFDEGLVDVLWI
jgi:hypothetical protein